MTYVDHQLGLCRYGIGAVRLRTGLLICSMNLCITMKHFWASTMPMSHWPNSYPPSSRSISILDQHHGTLWILGGIPFRKCSLITEAAWLDDSNLHRPESDIFSLLPNLRSLPDWPDWQRNGVSGTDDLPTHSTWIIHRPYLISNYRYNVDLHIAFSIF